MESMGVPVTIANRRQKFLYLSIAILLFMTILTTGILIFDKVQEQTLPIAKRPTHRGQTLIPLTSTGTKGPLTTEITTIVPTTSFTVSGQHDASMSSESAASASITHVSSYEQNTTEIETSESHTVVLFPLNVTSETTTIVPTAPSTVSSLNDVSISITSTVTHVSTYEQYTTELETSSSRMVPFTTDITSSAPFQTDTASQTESTTTPNCEPNLSKTITNDSYPVDCSRFNISVGQNAVHTIYPYGSANKAVLVKCVSTYDGIWTVIQNRFDGSIDFFRNWNAYKEGFGSASGEFWLGNDVIYQLTSRFCFKLKVVLKDRDSSTAYAIYDAFKISNEGDGYRLTIEDYHGDAGDSLYQHNGMMFSTPDRDNDVYEKSCAEITTGAWWYRSCYASNLNGRYSGSISWVTFSSGLGLTETAMMIQKI